jgi:hypothetical protein
VPGPGSNATIIGLAAAFAALACCAIFARHLALRLAAGLLAVAAYYGYYRMWGSVIADYDPGAAGLHWPTGLEATIGLGTVLGHAISSGPS